MLISNGVARSLATSIIKTGQVAISAEGSALLEKLIAAPVLPLETYVRVKFPIELQLTPLYNAWDVAVQRQKQFELCMLRPSPWHYRLCRSTSPSTGSCYILPVRYAHNVTHTMCRRE